MAAVAQARPSETKKPKGGPQQLGPYSRRLRRGVISDNLDGRSPLGRYCRDLEAQLIAHVGGAPSITQRLLIERAIKVQVQLDALDAKLLAGDWTAHDQRTHGGLLNALRLCCREIGMKPTAAPRAVRTLDDVKAELALAAAAEAAARRPVRKRAR